MDKKQQAVLQKAAKTTLKNENVLSGNTKYINPIHKPKQKPKKSFLQRLFS